MFGKTFESVVTTLPIVTSLKACCEAEAGQITTLSGSSIPSCVTFVQNFRNSAVGENPFFLLNIS